MAVRRYRRVEDIPPPEPAPTPLAGIASACALAELCVALGPHRRAPRGVRRFTSVHAADTHREAWESGRPADA